MTFLNFSWYSDQFFSCVFNIQVTITWLVHDTGQLPAVTQLSWGPGQQGLPHPPLLCTPSHSTHQVLINSTFILKHSSYVFSSIHLINTDSIFSVKPQFDKVSKMKMLMSMWVFFHFRDYFDSVYIMLNFYGIHWV